MGGFNSGGGRGALRTGYFLDLDLASLKRLNMLRPGYSGSLHWSRGDENIGTIGVWVRQDGIRLSYRSRPYGGEWETIEDTIPLVETEVGFGGRRKWFLCPSCMRRVRILYGGRLYRCRTCRSATYESQYEPLFHASHQRIRRLKKRLGDRQADTWSGVPDRPKGMHHKTYERLCDEIWNEEMKMDRALGAYARMKGFEV
jgi:ribosomal protein L37AE/L43A